MNTSKSESTSETAAAQWAAEWLEGVADGSNTMSQRKRSSVEKRGGGLEAVAALARERGVHLLLLEDDQGNELVAASTKPFEVVCEHGGLSALMVTTLSPRRSISGGGNARDFGVFGFGNPPVRPRPM